MHEESFVRLGRLSFVGKTFHTTTAAIAARRSPAGRGLRPVRLQVPSIDGVRRWQIF